MGCYRICGDAILRARAFVFSYHLHPFLLRHSLRIYVQIEGLLQAIVSFYTVGPTDCGGYPGLGGANSSGMMFRRIGLTTNNGFNDRL
jgi:hypothetical protein